MRTKRISINGKRYIRYEGTHSELIDIMKEGDLVTLLRRSEDGSEVAKIIGVVKFHGMYFVGVSVAGANRTYSVEPSNEYPSAYKVTCVKRPVENMLTLPDSPGLWKGINGAVWCVLKNDHAYCIRDEYGDWQDDMPTCLAPIALLADRAPFTKLTLTEEEH